MKYPALLLAVAAALATTAHAIINDTDASSGMHPLDVYDLRFLYTLCGVDIVGYDVTNRQIDTLNCIFACANAADTGDCDAVSWTSYQGGTCYLKNTNGGGLQLSPNAGVDSHFIRKTDKPEPERPPGLWSTVLVDADMPGYDIGNVGGRSIYDCKMECAANTKCFAVTWTDYQGGWCWLKKRASATVPKAGAISAHYARRQQWRLCDRT